MTLGRPGPRRTRTPPSHLRTAPSACPLPHGCRAPRLCGIRGGPEAAAL